MISGEPGSELPPRTAWLLVALATALAAALRLPFLGHQSLWLDEIYTRDIVGSPSLGALWHHVRATESTPPLFYLIGWALGGRGAAAMRAIPAVALIAVVPVGFLAVRRLSGQRAGLACAAMLAVSPLLVFYSLDARSYGLLTLTSLASVWAAAALMQSRSPRWFAIWAACSIVCVWTHYFGAFVVGAEALVLLLACPRDRLATILWSAAIAVGASPLLPLAASQSGDDRAEFIAGIPLGTRVTGTVREFAMGPNVPRTWLEAAGLVVFCGAAAVGAVIAARSGRGPRALMAITAITLGIPLLMSVTGIDDRFDTRNVIMAAPLVIALAAPAMLRLRMTPLAAYLALAALTSIWVSHDWRYQQPDWRGALATAEARDPAAPVLALDAVSEPVVRTYLDRQPARGAVVARRVWIVVPSVRSVGQRALGPVPAAPALPGFTTVRSLIRHGFRISLAQAPAPTSIEPSVLAGATLFPGRP